MSNDGSLTLDDFLVSLSNSQSENFSKMWELLWVNLDKLKTMEKLLNEIKVKLEKLEKNAALVDEGMEEPEAMRQHYKNPFMDELENLENENFDTSSLKPRLKPLQKPEIVEGGFDNNAGEEPENSKGKRRANFLIMFIN